MSKTIKMEPQKFRFAFGKCVLNSWSKVNAFCSRIFPVGLFGKLFRKEKSMAVKKQVAKRDKGLSLKLTEKERDMITKKAKKEKISRTELIVRAVTVYGKPAKK